MYVNPILFSAVTNRESWNPTVGLYDDDTDEPFNLTNTQGSGTFAAWSAQVSATLFGAVLLTTTSISSLTIAQGTITATVAPSLNISAGQYVKFLSQANTTIWMQGKVSSYNSTTGVLVFVVSSGTIALEIRRAKDVRQNSGYIPYYDWSVDDGGGPVLSASMTDGRIVILDLGVFQVSFTLTDMRSLCPGTYVVACVYTSADGLDTRQLFIGRLPVLSGYIT